MLNIILNSPENRKIYSDRITVKGVIFNQEGKILVFNSSLVGGGVENNETNEEALHREALEEAGIRIEIIKPLGKVIAYRHEKKLRYVMYGYLCKFIKKIQEPTDEIENPPFWEDLDLSINRFNKDIKDLEENNSTEILSSLDRYEAKLYNKKISELFILESKKHNLI